MARKIIEIEEMTTEDCTFSVGVVHGGQWVNCVATTCRGEALSHGQAPGTTSTAASSACWRCPGRSNDVHLHVTRGVTRPVWEPDGKAMALYETARGIAQTARLRPHAQSAGGGSDGNFTGAMGIPTLDGLGVQGAGYHTLDEHIEIDSLVQRGRLMAGLLATLS